jgi:hypothetical protein
MGTGRAVEPAISDAWLEEIAEHVGPRLPLSAPELAALVPRAAGGGDVTSLAALSRSFARAGRLAPFRVVRRGAVEIAVTPGSADLVALLYESATRQVNAWGLTEIDDVLDRVAILGASDPAAMTVTTARRLLSALPQLRWLDERHIWFSFVGERSPLGRAIEKVLSIADAVDVETLRDALAKHHHIMRRTPRPALEVFLTAIAGCRLSDGILTAVSRPAASLSKDERALVERLRALGGQAAREELEPASARSASALLAWRRLVRRSPLVLPTADGRLRLVGHVEAGAGLVGAGLEQRPLVARDGAALA